MSYDEMLAEILPAEPPVPDPLRDRMQEVQAAAVALDAEIRTSPVSLVFRAAWWAWLDHLNRWSASPLVRQSALEPEKRANLQVQIDGYASDLESWHLTYRGEQDRAIAPTISGDGEAERWKDGKTDPFLPWWAWAIGGAAVAGGVYLTYKKAAAYLPNLKAARDALLSVPKVADPQVRLSACPPGESFLAAAPVLATVPTPIAPSALPILRTPEPASLSYALPSLPSAPSVIPK